MKNRLLLTISVGLFFTLSVTATENANTINAVIGDESFYKTFHRAPNLFDSEELRITTHLSYVLDYLSRQDISHLDYYQLENRMIILSHLEDYINAKQYPKNEHEIDERRPNFIDSIGNICAVGYLVEQTVGREVAEALNSEFQFDYILDMDSKTLDAWLHEYGLTKREAAMIQPTYGGCCLVKEKSTTELSDSYRNSTITLLSAQTLLTSTSLVAPFNKRNKARLSVAAAGLGLASVVSGVYNLGNVEETNPQSGLTVENDLKRNVSLLNIAFGTTSFFFNGLRANKLYSDAKESPVLVYSRLLHVPGHNEPVPSLSLNISLK